jgi:putative cardiolipin synthase
MMDVENDQPADRVNPTTVTALPSPTDGLLSRLALIDQARQSVDAQYYLWDTDAVGFLLLKGLIDAADRGVTIRLLVDDLKLRRRSRSIASLCLHPNIDIRVFNRWNRRSNVGAQGIEFIARFGNLDHRMHNKLIIADNERAIVGGRNIADEHYGLSEAYNLVDFDVLLEGPTVSDLSDVFEGYWQSRASTSGGVLARSVSHADLDTTCSFVRDELAKQSPVLSEVLATREAWADRISGMSRPIRDGAVRVVSDAPRVTEGTQRKQVIEALHLAIENAHNDVVVVTPFFVPAESDVVWYRTLIDRGIRVRVLTNSLASNPGTISNSGLNKQRAAVVNAGVELHELRTDAAVKPEWDTPPRIGRYLGLHAKLYVIDRDSVMLGSLNLDPRSKFINTEMGVLIHDAEIAGDAADAMIRLSEPDNSWRVELGPNGEVRWCSDTETLHRPPARGALQRFADTFFGWLPLHDYI